MEIGSIGLTSSANAQTVQQPRQQPAQPEAASRKDDVAKAQRAKESQVQQAKQEQQQAQPVTNMQGQVTGRVVNTFA